MWLSAGELVVVGILALLVFGPEKLPELARQVARFVSQLQNIAAEVKRNVDEVIHEDHTTPPAPQHIALSPAEQEHERYMLAAAKAEEEKARDQNGGGSDGGGDPDLAAAHDAHAKNDKHAEQHASTKTVAAPEPGANNAESGSSSPKASPGDQEPHASKQGPAS